MTATPAGPKTAQPQYSQHHEQEIIRAYFEPLQLPGQPRLLDIGAADGRTFSNTRALFDSGWGGVLVEPSPFMFPALLKECSGFPGVRCVNAAIGEANGLSTWYDSGGDFISTMDEEHRKLWAGTVKFLEFDVAVTTWHTLLEKHPGPYEFVNIDVEGTNYTVLANMPPWFRPRLLCVEHSPTVAGEHEGMVGLMVGRNYRPLLEAGPNLFFERMPSLVG